MIVVKMCYGLNNKAMKLGNRQMNMYDVYM